MTGDDLIEEMAVRLEALDRRQVSAHMLLGLMVDLRPQLATASERYQRLAEVLAELAQRDLIAPSKTRASGLGVDLPSSVTLTTTPRRTRPENPARRFPWVEELAWISTRRAMSAGQLRRLTRLSEWIAANRGRPAVPERERSLEIFGEDKVLGDLMDGILRERNAVREALSVYRCHPPMAVAAVDGAIGRTVLIVENGTPFHSIRRAARRHVTAGRPVDIGWVAYGAGGQLDAIIPSLADRQPAPTALRYFGDLDPEGLRFPAAAAKSCDAAGLPPLRPADRLYELLLDVGVPQQKGRPSEWPEAGLDWLGPHATRLKQRLGAGEWLAQEWVGIEMLSADSSWCTGPAEVAPSEP